jgi:hypothetical protein
MEAIGEQLGEFGGNVVVLGRVGVASGPDVSGFSDPAPGSSAPLAGSDAYAYDDGTRPSPGWPLHAVPAETPRADSAADEPRQAAFAAAESVAGSALAHHFRADGPLSLAEISGLVAQAAAAAPAVLGGAGYVEAAKYAGDVENLSRTVEYLQVLSAGAVDRTRTQAIAAADAARASRSRTGKGWVTGWDNGVETQDETDASWPGHQPGRAAGTG